MTILSDSLAYSPVELAFGTSGLRGLVVDMTDLECYINTAGFVRFLQQQNLPDGATIYVGGDLRDSTPRIIRAVIAAIEAKGYAADFCGYIPTPALAHFGLHHDGPSIMVTGSHIPADRNGIKFYKLGGEILKTDETAIKAAVATERQSILGTDMSVSPFNEQGMLLSGAELPATNDQAARLYHDRFVSFFGSQALSSKQVVVYQHSAVGRDMLANVLADLGAEVVTVGRSDVFVPIDTENVTPDDQAYFVSLAQQYPDAFAIVSTDGDSDRPFVIDEHGIFHRGDDLGAVVTQWLGADFAAFPISSSDAVDQYLQEQNVPYEHTRIGSPYVIVAMQQALASGKRTIAGCEVNGGFLLGSDIVRGGATMTALPTRDAFFPMLVALVNATEQDVSVSASFGSLPQRFTQAGLIDNFPTDSSASIIAVFSRDTDDNRRTLEIYFSATDGFGGITEINTLDGVRIFFDNGDIAHLRPSGNAPQMRIYSVAGTQQRADAIVQMAIAEPGGILRRLAVAQ